MIPKDYKALLQFSDEWFTLGVLTEEGLRQYADTYEMSEDKSSEHYRYGAFQWYLSQHRPLAARMANALYELGKSDPDYSMGGAIMADILHLPECPTSVIAKASNSGRKHLVRIAERKKAQ